MKKIFIIIAILISQNSFSQTNQFRYPLDVPPSLSANFGELRPNHFHSGIDLKTQAVVNKPVYSIADGYISRINISPSGYGLALYINHPDGKTSVYGHLNSYAPAIAKYIKEEQYKQERYSIDIILDRNKISVKKGDLVAYSGNTGSSMGPHVHFEIRKTDTQEALDPLPFFKNVLMDTQQPIIKGIAVYPIEGKGVINNSDKPFRQTITTLKNGNYSTIKENINAWGVIGVGINAIDKMNGTTNVYGVKKVNLFCNDTEIWSYNMSSFLFEQSRMINSFIDFDYWYNKKSFYMKSYIEPGNKLPLYKSINNGYIEIKEERTYNIRYELEDLYGNKTTYSFSIIGKKQDIPQPQKCSQVLAWDQNNHYISDNFSIIIPKDRLYTDVGLILQETANTGFQSNLYTVHNSYVPLNDYCDMKIKMTKDSIANKSQYGIVRVHNGKEYWIGGTYNNGYMNTKIRELGHTYTVSFDNKAPTITAVQPAKWVSLSKITIKVTDNKSGIKSYRGTIDGKFALFEHDSKSPTYIYKFDPTRLKKGNNHKLVFVATDACGNESQYEYSFKY